MSVYQFLSQLQRAWERGNATAFLDANNGQALQQAFIDLARRDALVQAPEVKALVAELRELQQTAHMLATHQVPWQGDPLSLSELSRKAADLLDSLMEAT